MRKAIVLGLAGILVGAMLSILVPAQAHHNDRALKRQVAALNRRVTDLENFVSTCLSAQGATRTPGYQGGTTWALDFDDTEPMVFLLLVDAECVTPAARKGAIKVVPAP